MIKKSIPALLCASVLLAVNGCKPSAAPETSTPAEPSASPAATPQAAASPDAAQAAASPAASPEAPAIELKDPVATVNGTPISKAKLEEAFNSALQSAGVDPSELSAEQRASGYRQILDELIMDQLVTAAAANVEVSDADVDAEVEKLKKQFPSEEDFQKQLAAAGQNPEKLKENVATMLRQQRWMQKQIGGTDTVQEADARKFYDDNPSEFDNPETVKASHILFVVNPDDSPEVAAKKEQAAKDAAARAKKGEDFTALAKQLSEEPGAAETGGDLGFFPKDRMVPEFAEAAFSMKPGDISDPVKTQFGWHVIKVTDKKDAGKVSYDEVKDQILAYLQATKQREAIQNTLKSLRDAAQVDNTLPPAK